MILTPYPVFKRHPLCVVTAYLKLFKRTNFTAPALLSCPCEKFENPARGMGQLTRPGSPASSKVSRRNTIDRGEPATALKGKHSDHKHANRDRFAMEINRVAGRGLIACPTEWRNLVMARSPVFSKGSFPATSDLMPRSAR